MTESSDDATVVTFSRSREHAQAQALPRVVACDRTDVNVLSASLSADIPFPDDPAPAASMPNNVPAGGAEAHVSVPGGGQASGTLPDDGAAFRQVRLAVTAGLVVLLVAVWIWQRRGAVRR